MASNFTGTKEKDKQKEPQQWKTSKNYKKLKDHSVKAISCNIKTPAAT